MYLLDLDTWTPTLLAIGLILLPVALLGPQHRLTRPIMAGVSALAALRYIIWRADGTIPVAGSLIGQVWVDAFFAFEIMSICSSLMTFLFLSRTIDRSKAADRLMQSPLHTAPVDVFIATYNESLEILERTVVGAKLIQHPNLRIWLLDDGNRPQVRALADEMGVMYTHRHKGKHAKAGNINNGLKVALATGRRPDFILLLDADFVARPMILRRTLGFFEDATIGIVQTPQHFFNVDPVQASLRCTDVWPDEQRFFFNHLLVSKDAWGAAFCCGTSAVFRVAALEACGGMATETVTEDMLTTFRMGEFGYRTIFLNEHLSSGLAPEGLTEFVTQRSRWCLGAMQQVFTRWSFAGAARISLINRISCLDGVLYWMVSFPFRKMVLAAPLFYWLFGATVIDARIDELVIYLVPCAVTGALFTALASNKRALPIVSDVSQMISSVVIMRTVMVALIKPFGHPFKVTAKGQSLDRIVVQWSLMMPFLTLGIATIIGLLLNMSPYSPLNGTPSYSINVFWSIFNLVLLSLSAAACFDMPRSTDYAFPCDERAVVEARGTLVPCRLKSLSARTALVSLEHGMASEPPAQLIMDDGRLSVAIGAAARTAAGWRLQFREAAGDRRLLLGKMFSGAYDIELDRISVRRLVQRLGGLLFR